jgi:peptidoglycan/LPS O-acetylase OafA/YrhL
MASTTQTAASGGPVTPGTRRRLTGLDGIRGLAALFVVIHHCFLMSYPGYPVTNGPVWTHWMIYGHLAVVVFIVLSGFSLAVAPARSGWQLGSMKRFAFRRAWRILPPYWPALVYSMIVAWTLVPQPGSGLPNGRTVLIYGLLVQDVTDAPSPNGAFWSIAIEAQLYFLLPVMLLVIRRLGALAMLAAVAVPVLAIGVLTPHSSAVGMLMRFTPQFAIGFALGVLAAGVLSATPRRASWPWPWLALLAAVPVITLIAVKGSVWTVHHYFWVDVAISPAVALLLAAVATDRPAPLVRFLDTRPVRGLGGFSYSLYLTHSPVIVAVHELVVRPLLGYTLAGFLTTLAIGVPLALTVARLFAAVFELPFTRNKSWPALRARLSEIRPKRNGAAMAVDH